MLHVLGMGGFGDSIYQRPFLHEATRHEEVWLTTPWPELYTDLPIRFVRDNTLLRCQRKNVERQDSERWSVPPSGARVVRMRYTRSDLRRGSILEAMGRLLPLNGTALGMDLPPLPPSPVDASKQIAVLRPVTVRREWRNAARNPHPAYVCWAARILREQGFHLVSVADVEAPQEWLLQPAPVAHTTLHAGELGPLELLALIFHADVVVGGVGWIVPACLAATTPLIVIGGGQGAHNAPEKVTHPHLYTDRMRWLLPEPYCRCEDHMHPCNRYIPDFAERFEEALEEVYR